MNISDCLGKKILLLATAETVGTVTDFLVNGKQKRLVCFVVEDSDGARLLPLSKVLAFGDCIAVMNSDSFEGLAGYGAGCIAAAQLLGYDTDGSEYGKLNSVEIDERGNLRSFAFEKQTVSVDSLARITGTGAVFFGVNKLRIRNSTTKKVRMPDTDYRVEMLASELDQADSDMAIASEDIEISTASEPQTAVATISTAGITIAEALSGAESTALAPEYGIHAGGARDYGFLIGRRLLTNLKNGSGELLAVLGTVVTSTLIEKVKRNGKLMELILNSK